MINTTLNFLGHLINVDVVVENNEMKIKVDSKSVKALEAYLRRALPHFNQNVNPESLGDLNDLIQKSIDFEASTKVKLAEPTSKLPYDIPVTTKEQLVEMADQDTKLAGEKISQTQVLIDIIEKKYAELFPEE